MQVHGNDALPVLDLDIPKGGYPRRDPGIGDDDVEMAELADDLVYHPSNGWPVGDICLHGDCAPALCPDRLERGGRGLCIAPIVDGDVCALPREFDGNCSPDAARSAGDESARPG